MQLSPGTYSSDNEKYQADNIEGHGDFPYKTTEGKAQGDKHAPYGFLVFYAENNIVKRYHAAKETYSSKLIAEARVVGIEDKGVIARL